MFFLNRDPREAARKNQFDSSLPLPVEWEWDGMRAERKLAMNTSLSWTKARLRISYPESKVIVVLHRCKVSNLCSLLVCASVKKLKCQITTKFWRFQEVQPIKTSRKRKYCLLVWISSESFAVNFFTSWN